MSDWAGNYPVAINVAVFISRDGEPDLSFEDCIAGLNTGHALWRARQNWPGAVVQYIPGPISA